MADLRAADFFTALLVDFFFLVALRVADFFSALPLSFFVGVLIADFVAGCFPATRFLAPGFFTDFFARAFFCATSVSSVRSDS